MSCSVKAKFPNKIISGSKHWYTYDNSELVIFTLSTYELCRDELPMHDLDNKYFFLFFLRDVPCKTPFIYPFYNLPNKHARRNP